MRIQDRTAAWLLPALFALGCAQTPNLVQDGAAGPKVPAAVVVSEVEYTGSKGYFAYQGEQRAYYLPQVTRQEQAVSFTESALGAFNASTRRAYLTRLDEGQAWYLDLDESLHRPCLLQGCFDYDSEQTKAAAQSVEIVPPGCRVSVTAARASLTPAGEGRAINGYSARAYALSWIVELEDAQGRRSASVLDANLWLAALDADAAEAAEQQREFQTNYEQRLKLDWGKLGELLPATALSVIQRYFLHALPPEEQLQALASVRDLGGAPGYPVGLDLEWRTGPELCRGKAPMRKKKLSANRDDINTLPRRDDSDEGDDGIETFGQFVSAIGEELSAGEAPAPALAQKATVSGKQPASAAATVDTRRVFGYAQQVKYLGMDDLAVGKTRLPPDYTQGSRF